MLSSLILCHTLAIHSLDTPLAPAGHKPASPVDCMPQDCRLVGVPDKVAVLLLVRLACSPEQVVQQLDLQPTPALSGHTAQWWCRQSCQPAGVWLQAAPEATLQPGAVASLIEQLLGSQEPLLADVLTSCSERKQLQTGGATQVFTQERSSTSTARALGMRSQRASEQPSRSTDRASAPHSERSL